MRRGITVEWESEIVEEPEAEAGQTPAATETMLRKRSQEGSAAVAMAMAVFLVFLTTVTVYIFWAKIWWFPRRLPPISAMKIDAQFARTFIITGIVFVAAQFGLA